MTWQCYVTRLESLSQSAKLHILNFFDFFFLLPCHLYWTSLLNLQYDLSRIVFFCNVTCLESLINVSVSQCWINLLQHYYSFSILGKIVRYLAWISFLRNVCVEVRLFCMICLCRSSSTDILHYFLCEFPLLNIFPVWNLHLSQFLSLWNSCNIWHKFCIYTQKPWHGNAAFWHIFWPYRPNGKRIFFGMPKSFLHYLFLLIVIVHRMTRILGSRQIFIRKRRHVSSWLMLLLLLYKKESMGWLWLVGSIKL